MARRLAAFAALVAMLVVPPLLLATTGAYEWRGVSLWTPLDIRLLLLVLTAVGWTAWGLWVVSVGVEAAALLSRGRLRVRLPLLGAGQAVAASLLAAVIASTPAVTASVAVVPLAATTVSAPLVAPTGAPAAPGDRAGSERASEEGEPVEAVALAASSPRRHLGHEVVAGDELWSLAQRYYGDGAQWQAIVAANPALASDPLGELTIGSTLTIVEPVELVTVRPGETLWRLAERHLGDGRRWPEILELNRGRIADPDLIRAGWVLRVPMVSPPAATQPDAPLPSATPPEAATPAAVTGPTEVTAPAEVATPGGDTAPAELSEAAEDAGPPTAAEATDGAEQSAPVEALVGGLSALTAGAVLGGLAVRRRVQEASRPLGRRYVQPGDDLRRVETALAVRSAAASSPGESPVPAREVLVGRAMRHLTAHWLAAGLPAQTLERVVVGEVDVEFVFVSQQQDAPEGYQHRGCRIAASWSRLARLTDPDVPVSHPALVTLGADAHGDLHMVDLLSTRVLGVQGPGPVADALSAMVVELACAPWASELGLLVVTDDPGFARAVASETVVCTPSVDAGVSALERLVAQRARFLDAPDAYDRSRLDPNLAEAWAPQVVLFETPPDADAVARLTAAAAGVRCGIAAVLPTDSATGLATWRLEGSDAVRGTLLVGDEETSLERLSPQTIPRPTRDAIASLLDLAQDTTSEPAPWWATPADPKEPDVNIIALRPVPAATGPVVRLLGPVVLEGATGGGPPRASRQCVEYLAWLLEHPGATATQMVGELLIADSTRRSNMSRLRTWLGADAAGDPYLPDAYSGRIHLHDAVTSDWEQFRQVLLGGVNRASTERLVAALELVRGAPLADAAPGQWHWAEELRSDMVALIRDAGVVLASRAREERNLELARWAANRALAAAPDDELLLGERLRTEYAAGRLDEVDRLAARLHRTARKLGTDLLPETVDVLQEVMEGRLRARRA